jgi:hypothetical protein
MFYQAVTKLHRIEKSREEFANFSCIDVSAHTLLQNAEGCM